MADKGEKKKSKRLSKIFRQRALAKQEIKRLNADDKESLATPSPRKRATGGRKPKLKVREFDLEDEDSPGSPVQIQVEQFEFDNGENICSSFVQEENKTPEPKKKPSEMSQAAGPRM